MRIRKAAALLGAPVVQHSLEYDPREVTPEALAPLGVTLPASLARAVPKRQIEWILARHCARIACAELGVVIPAPVGNHPDRSPIWPPGLVGAITHTEGFVSAAVARHRDCQAIGIDSERPMTAEVAAQVATQVCRPEERGASERLGGAVDFPYLTLLFSAKESIYKCLYPIVGRYFSYQDARVETIDLEAHRFEARLTADLGRGFTTGTPLSGVFRLDPGFVHTAIRLP
jgi:enterobactin synthetase component D